MDMDFNDNLHHHHSPSHDSGPSTSPSILHTGLPGKETRLDVPQDPTISGTLYRITYSAENAGKVFKTGQTWFEFVDTNEANALARQENPFWPFANYEEWEYAAWLECSGLSQSAIDTHLNLKHVSTFLQSHCRVAS